MWPRGLHRSVSIIECGPRELSEIESHRKMRLAEAITYMCIPCNRLSYISPNKTNCYWMKLTLKSLRPLFFALLNVLIPGAGHVAQGRLHWAIYTQISLALTVALLCWSRLVFEPVAIQISLGLILFIYLLSAVLCFNNPSATSANRSETAIRTVALFFICFCIWTAGFVYKQAWLGTGIYFVPSDSMAPTLNPGEFILVDTWAYRGHPPEQGDVVVFHYSEEMQWLVKRVGTWPDGKLAKNNEYYLLGDNAISSHDSRYFGGVTGNRIIGKVKLVLLGIDHDHQIVIDSFLKAVD